MKKRKLDVLILLIYSVPYVFLAMLADITWGTMLLYVLMVGAIIGLLIWCMKTDRMVIAGIGNVLSLLSSGLFARGFATEQWRIYFKAYSPIFRTLQFSAILLILQAVFLWLVKLYKEEFKDAS